MTAKHEIYEALYSSTDSDNFRAAIHAIVDQFYDVTRPTEHQLKIGAVNFYPNRGTIMIDGHLKKHPKKGLDALFAVLKEHCAMTITL